MLKTLNKLDKLHFLSCVDKFPIQTDIWGNIFQNASLLFVFNLHHSCVRGFLLLLVRTCWYWLEGHSHFKEHFIRHKFRYGVQDESSVFLVLKRRTAAYYGNIFAKIYLY